MNGTLVKRYPSAEDCTANAVIRVEVDGCVLLGMACWYPQMGGYVGKCLVVTTGADNPNNECFDCYVWHDGEFSFGDDPSSDEDLDDAERARRAQSPARLHHCMSEQFRRFADEVDRYRARLSAPPSLG